MNSPINFNDPTGHMCSDPEDPNPTCEGSGHVQTRVGNTMVHGSGNSGGKKPPIPQEESDPKNRKPGEPRCKANFCGDLEDIISGITMGLDVIGAGVSLLEAIAATDAYITAGGACIASEFAGCGPAFTLAFVADIGATVIFGTIENGVGIASLGFTALNDVLLGNTGFDSEIGPYVGKDTVVSGRNTLAGFIPESYIDLGVSISQLKYDADRATGNKPGGYIPMFDPSVNYRQVPFSKDFLSQAFLKDWR
jgi:hypothetical protein